MATGVIYNNFLIKRADSAEFLTVRGLFEKFPAFGFLSGCSRNFQIRFLEYALKSSLVFFVIAVGKNKQEPAGYIIAITHALYFWIKFFVFNFLAVDFRIFIRKGKTIFADLIYCFAGKTGRKSEYDGDDRRSFRWSPSSKKTARINFIGVLPDFRRNGVAGAMYDFLKKILKESGCDSIEAHIDAGNFASLKMHENNGWQIKKMKEGDYKAFIKF